MRLLVLLAGLVANNICASAHPLPDSTLTLARSNDRLEITLTIPVQELVLAQPALRSLEAASKNTQLPSALKDELLTYVQQHLAVTPREQTPLPLELSDAQLQAAHHADVGQYEQLVLQLEVPLPGERDLFPLTLTYDAVMHEVRNHRATVWLAQKNRASLLLGKFGFDAALGGTRPILIPGVPL